MAAASEQMEETSSSDSSQESSFREDPEIAAILERQRQRYAKEYVGRPEFDVDCVAQGTHLGHTSASNNPGDSGSTVRAMVNSTGSKGTSAGPTSPPDSAVAPALPQDVGHSSASTYNYNQTSGLVRSSRCLEPFSTSAASSQGPLLVGTGLSAPSEGEWPVRDRDSTIATLRRQLQDEREQYLKSLKQWEEERGGYLEEIRTKDRVIHQLEQELIERPSHRDIATMRADLARARDPSGRMKSQWKKQDPRHMMDADKKLHALNRRRKGHQLPPLDELDVRELRRFATSVLTQLKLADLTEADRAVEMMCKVVERTLPNLRHFAEEVYRIHDSGRNSWFCEEDLGGGGGRGGRDRGSGDYDATMNVVDQDLVVKRIRKWKLDASALEEWFRFFEDLLSALSKRSATGGRVLSATSSTSTPGFLHSNSSPNADLVDQAIRDLVGDDDVGSLRKTGDFGPRDKNEDSTIHPASVLQKMRRDRLGIQSARSEILRAVLLLVEFENRILSTQKFLAEANLELNRKSGDLHAGSTFSGGAAGSQTCGDERPRVVDENESNSKFGALKEMSVKMMRHFMQLFDVKGIEGVLPTMNSVFSRLHELQNFWKTLCVELRVDANLPPSKVLQDVVARKA
mmetsp:Transcript_22304/g.56397  ORF Transcript_22304/g.56397 Transcript_22304/m.56397 type:complete len:629 (+) Transcript_22304:85-1971(+)